MIDFHARFIAANRLSAQRTFQAEIFSIVLWNIA